MGATGVTMDIFEALTWKPEKLPVLQTAPGQKELPKKTSKFSIFWASIVFTTADLDIPAKYNTVKFCTN